MLKGETNIGQVFDFVDNLWFYNDKKIKIKIYGFPLCNGFSSIC